MSTPITPADPPPYEGCTPDISIKDIIRDMQDPLKVCFVEVIERDNANILTFVVDGYTAFSGDMSYLLDYNRNTVRQFFHILQGDEWELTQRYNIERIGHKTLPPIRVWHQKWLRW